MLNDTKTRVLMLNTACAFKKKKKKDLKAPLRHIILFCVSGLFFFFVFLAWFSCLVQRSQGWSEVGGGGRGKPWWNGIVHAWHRLRGSDSPLCSGVAGDEGSGSGSGSGCTEDCPTDTDGAAPEAPVVEADRSDPVDNSAPLAASSTALPTMLALSALALHHRQWR